MKGRFKLGREEEPLQNNHSYDAYDFGFVNKPVKSPSPDKRPANIIVSTKSPEISEIKRGGTPVKEDYASLKYVQRSEVKEKPFQSINTPSQRKETSASYKNVDTGPSSRKFQEKQLSVPEYKAGSPNSKGRNIKIEIAADNPTEEFEIRHSSSRYRSQFRGELTELDYLKILKSKEEHIRELKEVIEELDARQNNLDEPAIKNFENKINSMNAEIRELKVENQYLLSALQKNKPSMPSNKEEILQREIRQLRESLRDKQFEIEELSNNFNKKLEKERLDLKIVESENDSLLRLLKEKKDKQDSERSKEDLSSSALSVQQSQIVKSSEKERLSLIKIKEIHQQNIRITQESFYSEIKAIEEGFFTKLDYLERYIDDLNAKLNNLQHFKKQAEAKAFLKENPHFREQSHKEKERHQEIESVLLQKYSYYESQLQEQKKENEKLSLELTNAHKNIEELQLRSLSYSREASYLANPDDQHILDSLKQQNDELVETVKKLQGEVGKNQIAIIRLNEQKREKSEEIRLFENKLEFLLEEYESKIKAERNEHRQRVDQLEERLHAAQLREKYLVEEQEKDKMEIEHQIKDALKLYDKENSGLKQSLIQKNSDIIFLNQQFEKTKAELSKITQLERKESEQSIKVGEERDELSNRCLVLEKNLEVISQELNEANANLQQQAKQKEDLVKNMKELHLELAALRNQANRAKDLEKLNNSLRNLIAGLDSDKSRLQAQLASSKQQIDRNKELHGQEINNIQSQLETEQHRCAGLQKEKSILTELLQSMKSQRLSLRYETIEEELKELKLMISEEYSRNKSRLDSEILEEYYKLNHLHEIKIEENLRLLKEVQELKTHLSQQKREKALLVEKIAHFQNNIAIYERELRQRRQLYEQVLQEKVRIEKEVLLSKKIKAEQSNLAESFRTTSSQITSKIDRLVEFQRQRCRQIKQLVQDSY